MPTDLDTLQDIPCGFQWGPVRVTRTCRLPDGTRVVTLRTDHQECEVAFSAKGRAMHVARRARWPRRRHDE